jgi:hypothetical protein
VPRPPPGPGKSDQTPAGLLAHRSSHDARPSQAFMTERPAQWLPLPVKEEAICIALAAYSCRDSLGFGWRTTLTAFPIKPLSGHRRDHADRLQQSRAGQRGRCILTETIRQLVEATIAKVQTECRCPLTNVGSWEATDASRTTGIGSSSQHQLTQHFAEPVATQAIVTAPWRLLAQRGAVRCRHVEALRTVACIRG